jgi:ubiquinone biosynthesis protein
LTRRRSTPGADEAERPGRGERIARALEELGPTFVKLGQLLSTRADLLPPDVVAGLVKLQDQVPPFPFDEVRRQVEQELGAPLENLFAWFDPHPLAAASIGQVHVARLFSGEEVVVKVQRPNLEELVETDLEILFEVARLAERHTSWGRLYDLSGMVEEFADTLHREMDYRSEARHAERFRQNLADMPQVYIPRVYWDYTTRRVLTMENVNGIKLNEKSRLAWEKVDCRAVARILALAVLRQMFLDGFFHADLHPGNLAVLPGPVVVFLDFGMVGVLSPERRVGCLEMIFGLLEDDLDLVVHSLEVMGVVPRTADQRELRRELERLRARYYDVPFSEMAFFQVLRDLMEVSFRYRLRWPTELTLLAKTLITLEGVLRELDPRASLAEIAEEFGRRYMWEQVQPKSLQLRLWRNWRELTYLAARLPRTMYRLAEKLADEGLGLELRHREVPELRASLERMTNRLSFSIVLLSFSIVMTGLTISSALVQRDQGLFFWRLPVLEIGFAVAAAMFLGLIWTILRSGRL